MKYFSPPVRIEVMGNDPRDTEETTAVEPGIEENDTEETAPGWMVWLVYGLTALFLIGLVYRLIWN